MKKYILLFSVTGLLVSGMLLLSALLPTTIPKVKAVKMQKIPYIKTITVNGVLEEQKKKDIVTDLPIVPKTVDVEVGEKIKAGDVIATVDINATKDAIARLASNYTDVIPQEILTAIENFDFEKILSSGIFPTEIVSTASGTVTSVSLSEGNITLPKTTAAVVSTTDKLRIRFFASEEDVEKIKEGSEVLFTANALRHSIFSCTVSNVAPTAYQRLSGLSYDTVVDVVADVNKNYAKLKSGYSVKGEIPIEPQREMTVLPYEAIFQDNDGNEYVYVYENKKAKKRIVTTGEELSTSVEITSGLTLDDIVVYSNEELKDGEQVMIWKA